jgi:hypothetical protein
MRTSDVPSVEITFHNKYTQSICLYPGTDSLEGWMNGRFIHAS